MSLALKQAKINLGNTSVNPSVGCVVVKNNCVISSGKTSKNGRPHAEFNVIYKNKRNFSNSDLYVTLEPCSHTGKTPPCVNLIKNKKIKRVFFSIFDPDIRSYNKAINFFKENKIIVKKGALSNEVNKHYNSYIKFKNEDLPFVTAKIAVSKDMYTVSKKKKLITNELSRGRVHLMRSRHDCIITSVKSIIADNSKLNCRIKGLENTSPVRIILDKNLSIPVKSFIIKSSKEIKTIIFYNKGSSQKIIFLKKKKIKLIKFPLDKNLNFNLKNVLIKIKSFGYSRVFVESGLKLLSSFFKGNLVDNFHLFISNKNLNSFGKNSFLSIKKEFLIKKINFLAGVNLNGDKLISYTLK